jgi:SPP1 gp7 family putative phage head morphogenesis protein
VNPYQVAKMLQAVESKHSRAYVDAIQELVVAMARQDHIGIARARKQVEDATTEVMSIGELIGAQIMLHQAADVIATDSDTLAAFGADRRDLICFREAPIQLGNVTFTEAVQEMLARVPVTLRNAADRTARRISELYSKGRVLVFARATEHAVTERVKSLLVSALKEGITEGQAAREMRLTAQAIAGETSAWSDAYGRMAFRTNVNTAVTAGRFRQSRDEDIAKVLPCFRFDATGDSDTRDNHQAADGLIFRSTNPVWNQIAPPLGYNCRCNVSAVSTPMLRRMGRIDAQGNIREDRLPAGAFSDPGFRHTGRPDLFISGAV